MGGWQWLRIFFGEFLQVRLGPLVLLLLLFLIPLPHEIHAFYVEEEGTLGTETILLGKIILSHAVTFIFNVIAHTPKAPIDHLALWGVLAPVLLYGIAALVWTVGTRVVPVIAHSALNKPRVKLNTTKRKMATNIVLFLVIVVILSLVIEAVLAITYPQKTRKLAGDDEKKKCIYHIGFSYEEVNRSDATLVLTNYVIGNPFMINFNNGSQRIMSLNSSAGIVNIPNCEFRKVSEDGTRVITYLINNYGLRMDSNITLKKPDEKKRVLILGDSFAFGVGIDQNETVSAIMQKLVGNGTEVLNGAVQGLSSLQSYALYYDEYTAFDADVVIFFHYMNDIMGNIEPRTDYERPVYDFTTGKVQLLSRPPEQKTVVSSSRSSFSRFSHVASLIDKNRDVFLNRRQKMREEPGDANILQTYKKILNSDVEQAYRFNCALLLSSFSRIAKQRNQTFLLAYIPAHIELDEPYFQRTVKSYKDITPDQFDRDRVRNEIAACASEKQLNYIDLTKFFIERTEKKPLEWYNAPGSHWSPKATNLTAHIVYDWMKKEGIV